MMKAIKESKVHTSWINDNQAYDAAMAGFVEGVLAGPASRRFFASFLPFQARVARLAVANSLAQVVLKVGSPGVPDFYQGTELWDLHLVDPDNRQPVDFEARRQALDALAPFLPEVPPPDGTEDPDRLTRRLGLLADMLDNWDDGRIKLWVTTTALRARRAWPSLFAGGGYIPLEAAGSAAPHVFSFARTEGPASDLPERGRGAPASLILVPRLVTRLGEAWRDWAAGWGTTFLPLPPALHGLHWANTITGERVDVQRDGGEESLPVAAALARCPVAILAGASPDHG